MEKDSNIHCEYHVEDQNSLFQDMDKESNIHSRDLVKQQNSSNMCKEHVLDDFDAIKATVDIIDKRKGRTTLQLASNEKSDPVFDCTQLEVDTPIDWSLPNLNEPFSQSYICGCTKNKGSVGFNDVLDPECKDHQLTDNVLKCLVKHVDMMCGEAHKSDDNLDETLAVGVIVDCATLQ
nr:hypothetical protein [Tanacetum cinerariifolium]